MSTPFDIRNEAFQSMWKRNRVWAFLLFLALVFLPGAPSGHTREIREPDFQDLIETSRKTYSANNTPRPIDADKRAIEYTGIGKSAKKRAERYMIIGETMAENGKYDDALSNLFKALTIYMDMPGAEREQGACNRSIGMTFRYMGELPQAIDAFEKAIANLKSVSGAEREVGNCYVSLGVALGMSGLYEEAIARQVEALAIFSTIAGAETDQQACYMNIGTVHSILGEYRRAERNYEKALDIFKKPPGDWRGRAKCYANLGSVRLNLGDYGGAAKKHGQALRLFKRDPGMKMEQAGCLLNMALIDVEMGETKQAISKCNEALAIYESIGSDESVRAGCHSVIGKAHFMAGRLSDAVVAYIRAKNLSPNWRVYRDLGNVYRRRGYPGDGKKALSELIWSMRVAEARRLIVVAADYRAAIFEAPSAIYHDLVSLLIEQGDEKIEAAFHFADRGKGRILEEALREGSVRKASRGNTKLLAEHRDLSLRLSKLSSSRESLPKSDKGYKKKTMEIDMLLLKKNKIEEKLKKTSRSIFTEPDYRDMMEIAKDLEPDRAVLQYSVGKKDAYLMILTREGGSSHKLPVSTPELPELLPRQVASFDQLFEAWSRRADKIGLDGLVRLARARAEDITRNNEKRHNLIDAEKEKAILEYLGKTILPGPALGKLRTKGIRRLLIIPGGSLHYIPFSMLRLKKKRNGGTHYLVEEFASSYISSITMLDTIRKRKHEQEGKVRIAPRSLLAFANPSFRDESLPRIQPTITVDDDMRPRLLSFRTDYYRGEGLQLRELPETEQEAIRVASLFEPYTIFRAFQKEAPRRRAMVFTKRGASEEQVKQLLRAPNGPNARIGWKYVLFATHGLADTRNGMLSCLALSSPTDGSEEDGFLQAQEVMNLEINSDVVVLSSCQTGLGRPREGEGLVGLSTAFFSAGAESVCASLWKTPSDPTSQLVQNFFIRLEGGNVDRSEALRQAQLQLLSGGENSKGKSVDYSTPFCWAAFVLSGEYR